MLIRQSVCQSGVSIGAVGVDLEQLSKGVLSFCGLLLLQINQSKPVIRVFAARIQRNHAPHFQRSILEVMLRNVGTRQGRVGGGEVGPQAHGFLQLRNPFVRLSLAEKSDSVLSMKQISVAALQPHRATHHEQSSNQQHRDPPQKIVMSRSDLGDERAEQQSHEQAADVRRVIDVRDHRTKEEVVSDKYHNAAQRSAERGAGQ